MRRLPEEEWGAVDRALAEAATASRRALGRGPQRTRLDRRLAVRRERRAARARVDRRRLPGAGPRTARTSTIVGDALVDRVVVERGRATASWRARRAGEERFAGGEVILCAGAIHSPAILLRSGIGPADELRALGITPVADQPPRRPRPDRAPVGVRRPRPAARGAGSVDRPAALLVHRPLRLGPPRQRRERHESDPQHAARLRPGGAGPRLPLRRRLREPLARHGHPGVARSGRASGGRSADAHRRARLRPAA